MDDDPEKDQANLNDLLVDAEPKADAVQAVEDNSFMVPKKEEKEEEK